MRVEAVTNVVTEPTPDPRWPWVITAAQLQCMTFPEEPRRRRERAAASDGSSWWHEGDPRWRAA
jgi:hypothetical protein